MSAYNFILIAWKQEIDKSQLFPLEPDFYTKCRDYLHHLENQSKNDNDELLSKLFHQKWTRVNYILNDLITLRLEKHIRNILNDVQDTGSLPIEEVELHKKIKDQLSLFRNKILGIKQNISLEDIDVDNDTYEFVIFTSNDNQQIIGADLKTYGPFNKGDVALIPQPNIRNYLLRSKVEKLEI